MVTQQLLTDIMWSHNSLLMYESTINNDVVSCRFLVTKVSICFLCSCSQVCDAKLLSGCCRCSPCLRHHQVDWLHHACLDASCVSLSYLLVVYIQCILRVFLNSSTVASANSYVHHSLSSKHYGLIKGRSTVQQLLKVLGDWTEKFGSGWQIIVLYTDLDKIIT